MILLCSFIFVLYLHSLYAIDSTNYVWNVSVWKRMRYILPS